MLLPVLGVSSRVDRQGREEMSQAAERQHSTEEGIVSSFLEESCI